MATINDVILTGEVYQDVYGATGLVIGTPVIIQNKSSKYILIQLASNAPAASDKDGFMLLPSRTAYVENASEGLWAIGTGRLHVEQDT